MDNLAKAEDSIDRKLEELQMYERLYSSGEEIGDSVFRNTYLRESESLFEERLRKCCVGKRVLEIGTGTGDQAILAARAGAAVVVGIDISPCGIQRAEARAKAEGVAHMAKFMLMDIESMTFPAGSFDLILDHGVFSSICFSKSLWKLLNVLSAEGTILGIECFAHNPLFNINRRMNMRRGLRTKWATRNIFSHRDLTLLRSSFRRGIITHHHLAMLFAAGMIGRARSGGDLPLIRAVEKLDRLLLSVPWISALAFKVVFEFSEPLPGMRRITG